MNHKKIYDKLCERGITRLKESTEYYEKHHIIPKCMGGANDKSNLTNLTAREHFIAHLLLTFIYPVNHKMNLAIWAMMTMKSGIQRRDYRIGARQFERLRKEFCKSNSILHKGKLKGKDNPFYGKTHSDEFIQRMKNKVVTDETRVKMSIAAKARGSNCTGVPKSKETLRKLSENSSNAKKVIHIESGITYRSMTEASKYCGISHRNIFEHCKGNTKKQRFKYK